jgi:pimeloyl-ACP methyl ester carboxylesterase
MSASVRANGLDIHYVTEGQGPPLLMLHGATSMGIHDWGAQRPLLRSDFTLYMPDARGHHRTVYDVRQGWSRTVLVDDVLAFADALGLPRFHIMALSMGARTALELAVRHADRVLSMLVIAPMVRPEPGASVARARMDPETILRDEPVWAAELRQRHDPHQGEGAWRRLIEVIGEDTQHVTEVMPEELRRIRLPVLLAVGDDDPWMPLDEAVRVKRQLPGGQLLVVPQCGHVVEAERPGIFNPAMTQFFRRTRSALV